MATVAKRRDERYAAYNTRQFRGSYDGSAVRQLTGDELLRPRPQVRPRPRTIARPKVQLREAGKVSVFAVVGFLAVGMLAVVLLLAYTHLTMLSDEVVGMKAELTTLQAEEAELRAQYELAYDLGEIEAKMTATGDMIKPQAGQVFYVSVAEPDAVTYFGREDALTGVKGAVDSMETVWRNVVEYFK